MENQTSWRRGRQGFTGPRAKASTLPARSFSSGRPAAKLFFTDVGEGRNVMLLHGWTADSHDWSWQLPVLECRYRTIAVDLRGHGKSEVVPSGGYTPADYVDDIEALIENTSQGDKFVLIGHSMGAQIAARLAVKRPDMVDAVVSVDGSLGYADDLSPVFQQVAMDLASRDLIDVVPALFDLFYDPATSAAFRHWHARRVQGMSTNVVRETILPLFLGPDQVGVGQQSELFCRNLALPTYHICRDAKQAERMGGWFHHSQSKIEVWQDVGHWIMQDKPNEINAALIEWIDRL